MAETTSKKLVRLTVYLYRNPTLTEEEFHKHWSEVHGPLVRGWLQRYGIIRYTQYHTPTNLRSTVAQMGMSPDDVNFTDYDGVADVLLESLEDFGRATQDPHYAEKVLPDEKIFLDKKRMELSVGWEEIHVDDGKVNEI